MTKVSKIKSATKIKSISKKSNKNEIVRIVIDDLLAQVVKKYKCNYPLLSSTEIIKIILSNGISNDSKDQNISQFLKNLKRPKNLLDNQNIENELLTTKL